MHSTQLLITTPEKKPTTKYKGYIIKMCLSSKCRPYEKISGTVLGVTDSIVYLLSYTQRTHTSSQGSVIVIRGGFVHWSVILISRI